MGKLDFVARTAVISSPSSSRGESKYGVGLFGEGMDLPGTRTKARGGMRRVVLDPLVVSCSYNLPSLLDHLSIKPCTSCISIV